MAVLNNLYIVLDENKNPVNHPILLENLIHLDPNVDLYNLPPGIVRFIAYDPPIPDIKKYEILEEEPEYRYDPEENVVHQVWTIRQMGDNERINLIENHKSFVIENLKKMKELSLEFSENPPPDTDKQMWIDHYELIKDIEYDGVQDPFEFHDNLPSPINKNVVKPEVVIPTPEVINNPQN